MLQVLCGKTAKLHHFCDNIKANKAHEYSLIPFMKNINFTYVSTEFKLNTTYQNEGRVQK